MRELLQVVDGHALAAFGNRVFLTNGEDTVELKPSSSTKESVDTMKNADAKEPESKGNGEPSTPSDVETVAMIKCGPGSDIMCAVSRSDKVVSIYKLADGKLEGHIEPIMVHKVPKKVSCLLFATIQDNSQTSNNTILLAGDLAGDVWALSLSEEKSRMMLGHTASMITGMCMSGHHLLTCDRDEKVRVSKFPDTSEIEGFLLGHTAFITSIASIKQGGKHTAVSASADGTLRVWDITKKRELAGTQFGFTEDNPKTQRRLPTIIAMNKDGTLLTVIFDGNKQVDLYEILDGSEIKFVTTTTCEAQPLALAFQGDDTICVLLEAPHYAASFQVTKTSIVAKGSNIASSLLKPGTDETLATRSTIIDKDDRGNPQLQKLEESRGPNGEQKPWARVERIEIAKNRDKRAKKRRTDRQHMEGKSA